MSNKPKVYNPHTATWEDATPEQIARVEYLDDLTESHPTEPEDDDDDLTLEDGSTPTGFTKS